MQFRTFLYLLLAVAMPGQSPKSQPLRPQKSIPLPGVEGRLDHLAIDLKNNRLFISATGNGSVEVIDLKTRPELAKADQILALPTLIRKIPEPMKRLIGDLSNAERAIVALDLGTPDGPPKHARHPD